MNELSLWLGENKMTKEDFGRMVGCSGVHIARITKDDPRVSPDLALRIYNETGIAVGPLKGKTKAQIKTIASASQLLSGAA